MKTLFLIIISTLLFQAILCAQTSECKYEKNEFDKFTNKKIVWTQWEHLCPLISKEYAPDVRCTVEDTVKQLLFYVDGYSYTYDKPTQASIDSFALVPAGSKALLLMEDGKSVELTTDQKIHSTGYYQAPYADGNSSNRFKLNWHVTLIYKLDPHAIKALTTQGVTTIRIFYTPENHQDYVVGKKKYSTIQNLMYCIQ